MKRHAVANAAWMFAGVLAAQAASAQQSGDAVESIVIQGSFLNTGAQSAMKLDAPVRDTPFSVSSYSDSFMKAIETANVADMYNYMTGIRRAGATGYDLVIRGMKSNNNDRNSILMDGLPGLTGRFGSPPTVSIEHTEVVKGPMSVLYGQAQPGGFINIITKKPQAKRSTEFDVKVNGYIGHGVSLADANGYEVAIDTTGPIDEKKKFLYRFIADTANRDTFRNGYERPVVISPSVTWNLDDATLLTAQFEYRAATSAYDNGLVVPNNEVWRLQQIDLRTRYQTDKGSGFQTESGRTLSLSAEHSFDSGLKWSGSFRSVRTRDLTHDLQNLAVATDLVTLQRGAVLQKNTRTYNFGDTNLSIPFATGAVQHKMLLGMNGGRETADLDRFQNFDRGACPATATQPCYDVNILNPVLTTVQAPPVGGVYNAATNPNSTQYSTLQSAQRRATVSASLGFYASDLMTFSERWKATLGLRSTREVLYKEERRVPGTPSRTKTSNSLLPMAGVLYQPTQQLTFYSSYSTSFSLGSPLTQDAFGNNEFKPERAKQYEVGVKGENLMDGRVTATLSVFRIDKTDAYYSAPCLLPGLNGCFGQVGGERSQGVEIETNLRPMENWQISAGYSFTDAKVTRSTNPIQVGGGLTNVPRNSASLWSRYDFAGGAVRGLGVGVGVAYTGARPGPVPTVVATPTRPNTFELPSYAVVDLGLYYTVSRYAFNLKVGNVFDRTVYESAGQNGNVNITPGVPRNVTLSMRTSF